MLKPQSVTLSQYLARKRELAAAPARHRRPTCKRCWRSLNGCVCDGIVPFETKTRFCILMHPREARKEKVGTGRLTTVALNNAEIIVGEEFTDHPRVNELISSTQYHCMILYPGEDAHNISRAPLTAIPAGRELLVFVIDGTWSCAKSMMRESKNLHVLPKISFDFLAPSRFAIKHQPAEYCLSTIESIHRLLDALDTQGHECLNGHHQTLIAALDRLVEFQIKCATDPTLNHYRPGTYRPPELRRQSKKWESRNICFIAKNYHETAKS